MRWGLKTELVLGQLVIVLHYLIYVDVSLVTGAWSSGLGSEELPAQLQTQAVRLTAQKNLTFDENRA